MKISNFKFQIQSDRLFRTLLVLIIASGIFFRLYNLNWGAPFYFHPDERNIASAVTKIKYPDNLNPQFFAYGSLPIYSIYFLGVLFNTTESIMDNQSNKDFLIVSFETAIFVSRILSSLFSILILFLLLRIAATLKSKSMAVILLILSSFSVGFIQYSRFGTFEMWLAFFSLLLFYNLYQFISKGKKDYFIFSSLILGVLVAIKISSLALFPLIPIAIVLQNRPRLKSLRKIKGFFNFFADFSYKNVYAIALALMVIVITSPFIFLDYPSFTSTIRYESFVALGTLSVFYTGGFINTTPILYQILRVYPFLVNPFITIIFLSLLPFAFFYLIKGKNLFIFLSLAFFLLLLFSQAYFFAKWTRYYVPTLPFLYLLIAYIISLILDHLRYGFSERNYKILSVFVFSSIGFVSFVFAASFFLTVQVTNDSRVNASIWAQANIPRNAKIVSEVYDIGITPFNSSFRNIDLYNFYELDSHVKDPKEIEKVLSSDYIVLPSQRIYRNRFLYPSKFPKGHEFYKNLFEERDFQKVYETKCDVFCSILYFGNPIYSYEETVNIFDNPTVTIFKRIDP